MRNIDISCNYLNVEYQPLILTEVVIILMLSISRLYWLPWGEGPQTSWPFNRWDLSMSACVLTQYSVQLWPFCYVRIAALSSQWDVTEDIGKQKPVPVLFMEREENCDKN